jgi:hypothetical protein
LSGQTKVTLELSPIKIIKAPDGYVLLRSALIPDPSTVLLLLELRLPKNDAI